MTNKIFIGVDSSKGYSDFRFIDQEGNRLLEDQTLDDTPEGHKQFHQLIQLLDDRFEHPQFVIGVESTGGFERNWLDCFKSLKEDYPTQVHQINPYLIRRFRKKDLHVVSTDRISAGAIARYLREGLRPSDKPFDPPLEDLRAQARVLMKKIDHAQELKNEFQSLLVQTHPYLVSYTRDQIPQWVLKVVKNYSCSPHLGKADPVEVARIPYLTDQKARKIISEAKESVAGRTGNQTAVLMQDLASDILYVQEKIKRRKDRIYEQLKDDPAVEVLKTIPGIGEWSATVIRLEVGSIIEFPCSDKLVAFCGLDPIYEESGDGTTQKGISKQGNKYLRRILFPCVQSAIQQDTPIQSFYHRLKEKGKHHMVAMVACMRKLVCIGYACWVKEEEFDPGYEKRLKEKQKQKKKEQKEEASEETSSQDRIPDLSAPVSRKEAKRRKELIVDRE